MYKNIYFTADQHFYHKNILKYCNRPFKNVDEMNKELIKRYNSVVTYNDICYFLGDVAMLSNSNINRLEPILNKLNGTKVLILGNHDEGKPFTYVNMGFQSVHTSLTLENGWTLVHDPCVSCGDRSKGKWWIVGHVHDLFVKQYNCINVGVDVWNFYPISWVKIQKLLMEN